MVDHTFRELKVKGMRPGVFVRVVCWVSLYSFLYQVLQAPRIGGEASNPNASTRSTQPTIRASEENKSPEIAIFVRLKGA